ncbi:uncharacterized protein METZ01_LOCUS364587, partial [marine metagenome]
MTLRNRETGGKSKAVFAYCAEQVWLHDRDRYLCSLFAGSRGRHALWALYALNLELARAREVVTQPMLGEVRLRWWHDTLECLFQGQSTGHPVVQALAQSWPSVGKVQNILLSLVDSRILELNGRVPKTLGELEGYLERTSSSLMRLSLSALGVDDESARAAGGRIGLAWGLVGLIRSLPFSSGPAQLSVPSSIFSELGCSLQDKKGGPSRNLNSAVRVLAERATFHVCMSRELVLKAPSTARAVLSLGALTRLYLNRITRANYDPYVA